MNYCAIPIVSTVLLINSEIHNNNSFSFNVRVFSSSPFPSPLTPLNLSARMTNLNVNN